MYLDFTLQKLAAPNWKDSQQADRLAIGQVGPLPLGEMNIGL